MSAIANFTIEEHEHGILVRGPLPVSLLKPLSVYARSCGWDLMDAGVSTALGATLAIVSKASGEAWRAAVDAEAQRAAQGDVVVAWLNGTDTGLSSKTLCFALTGMGNSKGGHTPWDAGDVGRCVRFLDLDPTFRARLPEVAERFPSWRPFVARWADIEDTYHRWCKDMMHETDAGQASARAARLRVSKLCEACAREAGVLR